MSSEPFKAIQGFVEEIIYTPFSILVSGWMTATGIEIAGVRFYLDETPVNARLKFGISSPNRLIENIDSLKGKFDWTAEIDLQGLQSGVYALTAFCVCVDGTTSRLNTAPHANEVVIKSQAEPYFQLGVLDHVLQNPQTKTVMLRGWVCASDTDIRCLRIYLDGTEIASEVTLGLYRPDVSDAYGWDNFKNTGWRIELKPQYFTEGNHDISVVATGTNSKHWKIWNHQRVKFVVGKQQSLAEEVLERGWIEKVEVGSETNTVIISGWAASNHANLANIEVFVDEIQIPARINFGIERKDVAFSFNQPQWEKCGWCANISEENLPQGPRQLTANAIGSNGERWNLQIFRAARCIPPFLKSFDDELINQQIVQSIYGALLLRLPNPDELDSACRKISKSKSLQEIITDLVRSEEIRKTGVFVSPEQPHKLSQSAIEEKKLVFLHVPKTGGMTLHQLLAKEFAAKEICSVKSDSILSYPLGALTRYRFFSGHFNMQTAKLIPGQKQIVTMVREPGARLISLYHYVRAHKPEYTDKQNKEIFSLASELGMSEFFNSKVVHSRSGRIDNDLVRSLTGDYTSHAMSLLPHAITELEDLAAFGILERFSDSVELIFNAIGKPTPDTSLHINRLDDVMQNDVVFRKVERESLTDKTRQSMASLIEADILLYQHALTIFDQKLKNLHHSE